MNIAVQYSTLFHRSSIANTRSKNVIGQAIRRPLPQKPGVPGRRRLQI
jgi:hypothetical protein